MLLLLMYHHVYDPAHGLYPEKFEQHLRCLLKKGRIVVPGERLHPGKLNICLTFDDGLYDFYACVYPLLKQYDLQAVLALPTDFILEDSSHSAEKRLNVSGYEAFHNDAWKEGALCTWKECREMVQSGHVVLASHSATHPHLSEPHVHVEHELLHSKKTIEAQTGAEPQIFVYPFGVTNPAIHTMTSEHYRYVMRIGSSVNLSWKPRNRMLYRVDAEHFWPQGKFWSPLESARARAKYMVNIVRERKLNTFEKSPQVIVS